MWGDLRAALNVVASSPSAGVCGKRQVLLLKLGAKRPRVLGSQICGLNGQTFYGPTFDAGWRYFARSPQRPLRDRGRRPPGPGLGVGRQGHRLPAARGAGRRLQRS
jgi:hypothetical protein